MTVATNDIIKVTAAMVCPAGAVDNVYQFRAGALLDTSDLGVMTDLAQKLDDLYTHMVAELSDDLAFIEVRGFNVTQDLPLPTVPWPSLTAGGHSGASGAAQLSAFGLLRTGISRVLGRKYFGIFPAASIADGGAWNSNITTAVAAALGELIGAFIAAGSLNVFLPGVTDKGGLFWGFIEGVATANPAVQRRRRFGRGV